jgi:hypothetical protein
MASKLSSICSFRWPEGMKVASNPSIGERLAALAGLVAAVAALIGLIPGRIPGLGQEDSGVAVRIWA